MAGKMKVWVGVGAYLLVSGTVVGCGTPGEEEATAAAQPQAHAPALDAHAHAHGHGGEGGEGGEGGLAFPPETDEGLELAIYQMRGHLWVAHELYRQGHTREAVGHFYHPTAEVYDHIRETLAARDLEQFEHELNALGALSMKGVEMARIEEGYQAIQRRFETVRNTIPADKRSSPQFVLPVVNALLQVAAHEYEEAVSNGRVTNAVEYQDALGFVMVARDSLAAIEPQLHERDAQALEELQRELDALLEAWPSALPPERAVKDPSEVAAAVSRVELASMPLR